MCSKIPYIIMDRRFLSDKCMYHEYFLSAQSLPFVLLRYVFLRTKLNFDEDNFKYFSCIRSDENLLK